MDDQNNNRRSSGDALWLREQERHDCTKLKLMQSDIANKTLRAENRELRNTCSQLQDRLDEAQLEYVLLHDATIHASQSHLIPKQLENTTMRIKRINHCPECGFSLLRDKQRYEEIKSLKYSNAELRSRAEALERELEEVREELEVENDLRESDKLAMAEAQIESWMQQCQAAERERNEARVERDTERARAEALERAIKGE